VKPEEQKGDDRFIFKPVHDHVLRALVMIAGFFVCVVLAVSVWFWQRPSWQKVGVAAEQPVPFSHKHHAGELGIDCRYCHTGVETSSYAGVPPTETCMTCHSQLWTSAPLLAPVRESARSNVPIAWQQVTAIPNYVYFNHSVHISRGVACMTCHGRIDQMPMTYQAVEMNMSWCLDCHRQPESHFVPVSQVTKVFPDLNAPNPTDWHPLTALQKARLTNCTVCHR